MADFTSGRIIPPLPMDVSKEQHSTARGIERMKSLLLSRSNSLIEVFDMEDLEESESTHPLSRDETTMANFTSGGIIHPLPENDMIEQRTARGFESMRSLIISRSNSIIDGFDIEDLEDLEEGDTEPVNSLNEIEAPQVNEHVETKGKYATKEKLSKTSKKLWTKIDVFGPIVVALFTLISSLWLFIQAGSYTKPMFNLWVVVSITTGEALGVLLEVFRFLLKPKSNWRWDRCFNYFFTSLIALIYGVVLRHESIYWTRLWIVTLLPITSGLHKYSKQKKWSKGWSNFVATIMLVIEVYRITLIGAVWEFSEYNLGLILLSFPLLYIEMVWISALCPYWLEFQQNAAAMIAIRRMARISIESIT